MVIVAHIFERGFFLTVLTNNNGPPPGQANIHMYEF